MRRSAIIETQSLLWTAMLVILAHSFIPHHHDLGLPTRAHHQEAKHPEQQPGHHTCTFHVNPLVQETQKELLSHLCKNKTGLFLINPVLSFGAHLPFTTYDLFTPLPLDHRWFENHPPFFSSESFDCLSLRAPPASC
jgi:hypothetical protein